MQKTIRQLASQTELSLSRLKKINKAVMHLYIDIFGTRNSIFESCLDAFTGMAGGYSCGNQIDRIRSDYAESIHADPDWSEIIYKDIDEYLKFFNNLYEIHLRISENPTLLGENWYKAYFYIEDFLQLALALGRLLSRDTRGQHLESY